MFKTCVLSQKVHILSFVHMHVLHLLLLLEEAELNNHNINELESLHMEMYCYVLGNRDIIFLVYC